MKFAVLIATRNRHKALANLLRDISKSTILPDQVVLVSSGEPISIPSSLCLGKLQVSHKHLEPGGQIAQKMTGINLLKEEIDWVIFFDDDIRLHDQLFEDFLEELSKLDLNEDPNVAGLGFKLQTTNRLKNYRPWTRRVARCLLLDSKKKGRILKSGHPTDYMDSETTINTEWLNGISAWRRDTLHFYKSQYLNTGYASMEDVFFSYRVSRDFKLLFIPSLRIDFQREYLTNLNTARVYALTSIWTYNFVCSNRELSIGSFFISQFGRSLHFFFSTKMEKNLRFRVYAVIRLNYLIFKNWAKKESFDKLLMNVEEAKWIQV